MSQAAPKCDVFSAIAEPRRREIIGMLSRGQSHAVGEIVAALGISQPSVSKHLGVLRSAGIVSVSKQGQHRLYRLNPQELRPVYEWVTTFERFWGRQANRIKQRAERQAKTSAPE
jgi:DNA-binding transcriptional ArsR family regulator